MLKTTHLHTTSRELAPLEFHQFLHHPVESITTLQLVPQIPVFPLPVEGFSQTSLCQTTVQLETGACFQLLNREEILWEIHLDLVYPLLAAAYLMGEYIQQLPLHNFNNIIPTQVFMWEDADKLKLED